MATWIQPQESAPTGTEPTRREQRNQDRARYGVGIRGPSAHGETDELAQVLAVAGEHVGRAHVIDRQNDALVFDGTMDELREAMRANAAPAT